MGWEMKLITSIKLKDDLGNLKGEISGTIDPYTCASFQEVLRIYNDVRFRNSMATLGCIADGEVIPTTPPDLPLYD